MTAPDGDPFVTCPCRLWAPALAADPIAACGLGAGHEAPCLWHPTTWACPCGNPRCGGDVVVGGAMCPSCRRPDPRGLVYGRPVRLAALRRRIACLGTRGRRGACRVAPVIERCAWCEATIPAGVAWCPVCDGLLRFTLDPITLPEEWREPLPS